MKVQLTLAELEDAIKIYLYDAKGLDTTDDCVQFIIEDRPCLRDDEPDTTVPMVTGASCELKPKT